MFSFNKFPRAKHLPTGGIRQHFSYHYRVLVVYTYLSHSSDTVKSESHYIHCDVFQSELSEEFLSYR